MIDETELTPMEHRIDPERLHHQWDNTLEPTPTIACLAPRTDRYWSHLTVPEHELSDRR